MLLGEQHPSDDATQPDEYYPLMVEIEPRHFWFGARNRLIASVLQGALGPLANQTVLDIGCGTGFVLAGLEQRGAIVTGIDMHLACLRYARARVRGPIVCASANQLPFDHQFDAALLCDVIEHCDDDVAVIREAIGAIRPNGQILITVPAHQFLWTALDDVAVHRRRYSRARLRQAMETAGLRVRLVRHFNSLLLPAQLAQRLLMRHRPIDTPAQREEVVRQAMRVPVAPINALLRLAALADLSLTRLNPPFGPSLIAVGTPA